MLTYGMIGDRLSDLVDELMELNLDSPDDTSDPYNKSSIARVIGGLETVRIECDRKVGEALNVDSNS